jgi:hypothetical protein
MSKKINCPKCQGTPFPHQDQFGKFISCAQCGWQRDLPGAQDPKAPGPGQSPAPSLSESGGSPTPERTIYRTLARQKRAA